MLLIIVVNIYLHISIRLVYQSNHILAYNKIMSLYRKSNLLSKLSVRIKSLPCNRDQKDKQHNVDFCDFSYFLQNNFII